MQPQGHTSCKTGPKLAVKQLPDALSLYCESEGDASI